ncbi:MAG: hypothetical protein ACRDP1_02100 [Nocardioidaceae bacterium]
MSSEIGQGVASVTGVNPLAVIVAAASTRRLDVICCEQIGPVGDGARSPASLAEALAAGLARSGLPYVVLQGGSCAAEIEDADPAWGIAGADLILLRRDPEVPLTVVDIDAGCYAAHRDQSAAAGLRPVSVRRGWLAVDLERGPWRTRIIVTHWDSADLQVRASQVEELVKMAARSPYPVTLSVAFEPAARVPHRSLGHPCKAEDPGLVALTSAGFVNVSAMNGARGHAVVPDLTELTSG